MTETAINYVELPCRDLTATKCFFKAVFGWQFTDYGPDYVEFRDSAITGGFYRSDKVSLSENGAALIVFYSADLAELEQKIVASGGQINRPLFAFPGGQRFHFLEPSGNEFAAWSH